jgi:hypothetical protein
MYSATHAIRTASRIIAALLLLGCAEASAQALYDPLQDDLDAIEAFSFSKRRAQGPNPVIQQERWTLYGRFGLVRFRNDFDPNGVGAQVTWRNTGPGLGGKKLFIGFQRRF